MMTRQNRKLSTDNADDTPGYHTGHITTTLMYEYQRALGPGVSSALSVLHIPFCLFFIAS